MNRSLFALALLAPLSLAVVACEKSGSDAKREADKAQAEANKEMNQATSEATTRITGAQMEADRKIGEAERAFARNRDEFRYTVQNNIDEIDKQLADLDAKSQKATGKKKAELTANLPALHARRDAYARDAKAIDNDTAATWDATKARLEKEWHDLKSAVDKID